MNKLNIIRELIKDNHIKENLIETTKIFGPIHKAYIQSIYYEGKSYYEVQIYGIVRSLKHLEDIHIGSFIINRKVLKKNFLNMIG